MADTMQTPLRATRRPTTLTALALTTGLALLAHAPAHAQSFSSQPVNVTYQTSNPGTTNFSFGAQSGTQTVTGTSTGCSFGGTVNTLVTPSQIVFTFPTSGTQFGTQSATFGAGTFFGTGTFNGCQVAETGVSPAIITGVSLNSASNLSGFNTSCISFTGTTVNANFQGLTFLSGSNVTLDLKFAPAAAAPAAVPEPSSVASMGLGSVGLLGMVLLARKRRRAA